ncbi:MAG: heavy metal translocating P-type ATPase [bacterium]|nr:heavy metal translocating P-type ATPase [bacterium]
MKLFIIPLIVLLGIATYAVLFFAYHLSTVAIVLILAIIFIGSFHLIRDTIISLWRRHFALDYIALLSIVVGVASGEYLVAAVIALMLSSGEALEKYAVARAKNSLTALTNRIPSDVFLWRNNAKDKKIPIASVVAGEEIFVHKGEVIPLDGILLAPIALTDESSLTGEPYVMEKMQGDPLRSGTVNVGQSIAMRVTKPETDSTYRKIIDMVQRAQNEQSPLVRIADRYSIFFTLITLAIAGVAFFFTQDTRLILAVLVIATPCPLILATPIALIGGMNACAKKNIIVKKLSSIEVLSRVQAMVFDKTGTITLGKPRVATLTIHDRGTTEQDIYMIAAAIERHSLHPLAKAIVEAAKEHHAPQAPATDVEERIGVGVSASVNGKRYTLAKAPGEKGLAIQLRDDTHDIATFLFEDEIKKDSKNILHTLKAWGLQLFIFTGDKGEAADRVVTELDQQITVKASCTPEDKVLGVQALREKGIVTAMVGDGLNDAPALASADVGMVFSNEEHTAASEAADVVFLGGDLSLVLSSLLVAKRTMQIALQSIWFGIGASIVGMLFAAFGFLPPLAGALAQEIIDVLVIVNALRASRS